MKEKNLNVIYNKEFLVIVPKMTEKLFDSFYYSFAGNVIMMNNNIDDIELVSNFINKNSFKKLIFVDYQVEYEELLKKLNKEHQMKAIYTGSLGALSDEFLLYIFNSLYKLYEDNVYSSIGFLDEGLYKTMKNKGDNVELINLDIPKNDFSSNEILFNEIGLLNDDNNKRHSFYNELSAIKLSNKYIAKIENPSKETKHFCKLFNIQTDFVSDTNLLKYNAANLYINFTDSDNTIFLKSMDYGVPCILGNTNLLDNEKYLKEMLVMKSDDDIDEIAHRLDDVVANRDEINKKYIKFREKYSKKSKETIEKFLGVKLESKEEENPEILISVIVPVYNTAEYLAKSLDSILEAILPKTEILIINDGSTDNSEEIILEYQKNYPNVIRYIKQKNHGLGNVRNVGLKEAKGKYIASIDSDDTINFEFFEEAYDYLEQDVDIVVYDWKTITDKESYDTVALDNVFSDISRYEALLYTTIMPSTCNKIMKKSLFEKLDINYLEEKYEDLSTNPFILLTAKTIKYINKPYYEYYIRSNSIMRSSAGISMIDVLEEFDKRFEKYKHLFSVNADEFKYYTYSWRIEEYIYKVLYTLDDNKKKEYIKYMYDHLYEIINYIMELPYYSEMLKKLPNDESRDYIIKRNKAFKDKKLENYLSKNKDKIYEITPTMVYYGF